MKISELGEFPLINTIAGLVAKSVDRCSPAWQRLIIGIGDDAAAWYGDTSIELATVDSLNQDIHFSLDYVTWRELGWKALAVNLSDIAAMGGRPRYALCALSLPPDTELDDVTALYEGMLDLAGRFGVAIIGGNISRAASVSVTVTVLGVSPGGKLLTRSGARPGDKIAVTGWLGGAAGGLDMLQQKIGLAPDASEALRRAFLQPRPRVAEGQVLADKGGRAAIDISDGLVADLGHICESSRVGARVDVERIPVHPFVRDNFGDRALELALSGGEDYELLCAAPEDVIDEVRGAVSCPVSIIGEIIAGTGVTLLNGGRPYTLPEAGWDHFKIKE